MQVLACGTIVSRRSASPSAIGSIKTDHGRLRAAGRALGGEPLRLLRRPDAVQPARRPAVDLGPLKDPDNHPAFLEVGYTPVDPQRVDRALPLEITALIDQPWRSLRLEPLVLDLLERAACRWANRTRSPSPSRRGRSDSRPASGSVVAIVVHACTAPFSALKFKVENVIAPLASVRRGLISNWMFGMFAPCPPLVAFAGVVKTANPTSSSGTPSRSPQCRRRSSRGGCNPDGRRRADRDCRSRRVGRSALSAAAPWGSRRRRGRQCRSSRW